MLLICPECQNEVDTSSFEELSVGTMLECEHCGISLSVISVKGDTVAAQVVDEGK